MAWGRGAKGEAKVDIPSSSSSSSGGVGKHIGCWTMNL
eukprot:CAMPEP_0171030996 /NCGR_PEP_ID=MMETSP0736-20130129/37367_1 /TAXON_ID=186038 /ORGANISM="Fragilariopsis kerguelensis, Strain L26-C5" /LENGTH=37 /DNA_ID= /DNA_START= /DNA_END= /DNA_ORIENTATION=